MAATHCNPTALFVLILREFLIARDIEMIIRNLCKEAKVILAPTLDLAEASLPTGQITAAFVQMNPNDFTRSGLCRRIAVDGGKTILVDQDDTDQLPDGWAQLRFPFVEQDVTALLASG